IRLLVGAEVLTGSTRLKAGTATKLALNMLSTVTMVQLGKCYENLMVDLRASNAKLQDRAARIIADITHLPKPAAVELLHRADGRVKPAILMHFQDISLSEAEQRLHRAQGNLRAAMNA